IEEFGVEVSDIVKLELESYRSLNSGLEGYVIDVDDFGNIITSVPVNVLTSFLKNRTGYIKLSTGGKSFKAKIGRKFTDAAAGEIIIIPGSKGFTEIAFNKGDASRKLKLKIGDCFQIF
ncbi:MAG: SAM hydroxide adenosyltransferase, partial [Candidatus Odinarchaeota archaeon]